MCYTHSDRPATFVRIEQRSKPVIQTRRIPQCEQCASEKPKRDAGLIDVTVRKL